MKKILLALVVIASSVQCLYASIEKGDTTTIKNPKLTVQQHRDILMQTRHEVRAGSCLFGLSSISALVSSLGQLCNNVKGIPSLSVGYSYRVVEFLEVGGFLALNHHSYTSIQMSQDLSRDIVENCNSNDYAVVAFARYSWLNRRYVQLYSSLGVGVNIETTIRKDEETMEVRSSSYVNALPEFVPIGIRLGGRLFGYFEPMAFSARGLVFNFGMGFRF